MDKLGRVVKRKLAKKIVNSLIDDLEEADHIMEKVADLGEEAYLNKLKSDEHECEKDFENLGQCTLMADKWIKKLGKENVKK